MKKPPMQLDSLGDEFVRLGLRYAARISFEQYVSMSPDARRVAARKADERIRDWKDNPRDLLRYPITVN